MCLTSDAELAERMRVLRDHGMNPKRRYWHDVLDFNYRMTNLQAVIGVAQLSKIERFIERKRKPLRFTRRS
jgi:perosamine synthetase